MYILIISVIFVLFKQNIYHYFKSLLLHTSLLSYMQIERKNKFCSNNFIASKKEYDHCARPYTFDFGEKYS